MAALLSEYLNNDLLTRGKRRVHVKASRRKRNKLVAWRLGVSLSDSDWSRSGSGGIPNNKGCRKRDT